MSRLRKFSLLALVALALTSFEPWKVIAATACSTGSTVDIDTDTTSEPVMPSAAPTGATGIAFFLNRANKTDTLSSAVGSTNGAYTCVGPIDWSTGNLRGYMCYFLNMATATETVTGTWSGAGINNQGVVVWCEDDSTTSPQTYDDDSVLTQVAANQISWTLTGADAVRAGPVVGVLFANSAQATAATNFGAGQSQITSAAAGVRIEVFLQSASGAGSFGFSFDVSTTTAGVGQVFAFGNPVAATGRKNMLLLGIGEP